MGFTGDINSTELYNILEEDNDHVILSRLQNHSEFKKFIGKEMSIDELRDALKTPVVFVHGDFNNLSEFDKHGLVESGEFPLSNRVIMHIAQDGYYERVVFNKNVDHLIDTNYVKLLAIVTNFLTNLLEGMRDFDTDGRYEGVRFSDEFYQYLTSQLYFSYLGDIVQFEKTVNEMVDKHQPNKDNITNPLEWDEETIMACDDEIHKTLSNKFGVSREMIQMYFQIVNTYENSVF